jgi:hypothetical protein
MYYGCVLIVDAQDQMAAHLTKKQRGAKESYWQGGATAQHKIFDFEGLDPMIMLSLVDVLAPILVLCTPEGKFRPLKHRQKVDLFVSRFRATLARESTDQGSLHQMIIKKRTTAKVDYLSKTGNAVVPKSWEKPGNMVCCVLASTT